MITIRIESYPGVSPVMFMPEFGDQTPNPELPDDVRPRPVALLICDQASGIEMPGGIVIPGQQRG